MALPDRFEPWHLLPIAAFLVEAGGALFRSAGDGIGALTVFDAVLGGLFWAFGVYVFAGTLRNYVSSYVGSGGSLFAPRFLAPFAVGGVAGVAVYVARPVAGQPTPALLVDAVTVGFWAFVLSMAVMLVASYVVAGYREAASERVE